MNYRGINIELTTTRTISATNYDDLDQVVKHVRKIYPEHKIFAVGFSQGGVILGGYFAKQQNECMISNAMMISVPMNFFVGIKEMEKTFNFYTFNRHFTKERKKYFLKYYLKYFYLSENSIYNNILLSRNKNIFSAEDAAHFENVWNYHFINFFYKDDSFSNFKIKFKSIREIDDYVSKQFGYDKLEDYYQDACLDAKIQNIRVPTLFLTSDDDLIMPGTCLPIEKIKSNPYIALIKTRYGGHGAFCEGLLPIGCNYVCRVLREYIQILFEDIS